MGSEGACSPTGWAPAMEGGRTVRRAMLLRVATIGLGGLLLVSCGGDEGFPAGTYVSAADVNGLGPVTVTYREDGTMTVEQNGERVSDGSYATDGDQITMSDTYCKMSGGQQTATYTWEWDDSRLTMTGANDACDARQAAVAELTTLEG
jgi:hypothetical protein